MTTLTVTATLGGSSGPGILLRIYVITGAKPVASQTGGSATFGSATNAATYTAAISTTSGSNVYIGGTLSPAALAFTGSNSTNVDTFSDTTNGQSYGTLKATNVTTGSTTRGFTTSAGAGGMAEFEILAATTLAEDASAPGSQPFTNTAANPASVTSGSFTPPAGSLIVAIVSAGGGSGVATMTVTDNLGSHLNWTEKAHANASAEDYTGIWIADVPAAAAAGGSAVIQPGRSWINRFAAGRQRTRLPIPVYQPPFYTITDSDSSTGTDTTGTIGLSDTDSSTSTDAGESVLILTQSSPPVAVALVSPAWILRFRMPRAADHPAIPWFLPPFEPVSDSDTGHGTDAAETIGVSDSDTGHGTDAGESITASLSDSDFSASIDFLGNPVLSAPDPETGTGTEQPEGLAFSNVIQLLQPSPAWETRYRHKTRQVTPVFLIGNVFSDSDSGHGADGGESITASLSDSDSGTGTDAGAIGLADSESGSAVDSGTIGVSSSDSSSGADTTGTIGLSSADASTGTDAGESVSRMDFLTSPAQLPPAWVTRFRPTRKLPVPVLLIGNVFSDTDSGTGTDNGESIAATLSSQDTSGATDQGTTVGLGSAETSSGTDTTGTIGVSSSDASTGSDTTGTIGLSSSDSSSSAEASSIAASLSDTDASSSAEASSITASLSDTDSSSSLDAGEFLSREDFNLGMTAVSQTWLTRWGRQRFPKQIQVYQPPPAAGVLITDSDSCLGEDAEIDAVSTTADTSTGTDGGEATSVFLRGSDACQGTDGGESLTGTWHILDSDSCKGTDSGYQSGGFSDTDTGHGTDNEQVPAGRDLTITDSDSGTGSDAHIVDVYAYVPLFRWDGGSFRVVGPVHRVHAALAAVAPPVPVLRAAVTVHARPALVIAVSVKPYRSTAV